MTVIVTPDENRRGEDDSQHSFGRWGTAQDYLTAFVATDTQVGNVRSGELVDVPRDINNQ
jgi:hypothetical protein